MMVNVNLVKVDLSNTGIAESVIAERRADALDALRKLQSGELADTGWVDYPNQISDSDLSVIEMLAGNIRENSDALLVLGVGGSYMGTRAVTDLIPGDGNTELIFFGYDFSERHLNDVLSKLAGRDYSILAVSKSGGTMEPMAAFCIMMEQLAKKYGDDEAAARTYVVTEDKPSALHDYAVKIGCHVVHMPRDIGGRYSIFTAVGLLPLAVHGINIREFINGARECASGFTSKLVGDTSETEAVAGAATDDSLDYAICRNIFSEEKAIEVLEVFDPYAEYLGHWLQQLFGESEGKDGKGLYPSVLLFNRDLHSMGQFLQEGSETFFETMLLLGDKATNNSDDYTNTNAIIPENEILPELSGKSFSEIERSVEQGVIEAHRKAGIPLITISTPDVNPKSIGELLYWFMIQCAVSALLLGVNPFDQPGVEAYKSEVKKLISKK